MYPSKFEHVPVQSIDDAITALKEYDDAELIAGGQSLVPLQKTRFASPDHLIDIGNIDELQYVEAEDDAVRVGALATHTEIQQAPPIRDHVHLFSECISQIADWPVRNQGTFGGTIAEADPSGDYLPVMQVLNPDIELAGPEGERMVPFDEFYIGMFTVDMAETELVIGARIPKIETAVPDAAAVGSTYKKHAERSGDYALVGIAAIVAIDADGMVADAKLSVGAVGPLTRATEAEAAVEGTELDENALNEAAAAVREAVLPDEEGPEGEYKEAMAGEFAERALQTAYERATENL
ncbi:xanthine dehydrogenase family protein subunit M [Natrinema versiforme]|uniref:FAD-binding PCMH-type domain-containing protein n=1 Tax=Natrinema versiforme TaxID=88724 RepID=A0A4P8WLU0_9EURY|nr:FAD binding domain-containing protein [Natrinema versiforme]QCS44547.1 hypothetical protein FEJ81_19720 [Natrinema versiforme]